MKLIEVATDRSVDQIKQVLRQLKILDISKINADLSVDVDGNVDIPEAYTSIPIKFNHVSGNFNCSGTNITSLDGAPQSVGGYFNCSYTNITSLDDAPQSVGRDFYCGSTNIASLQGAPQSVGRDFYCCYTNITSLDGAPQSVGGNFYCSYTNLASLHHIHKTHRNWNIGQVLLLPNNCTDIVGLALIAGIDKIEINDQTFDISHHDPHQFQEQLIDAGLEQQARL